MQGKALSRLKKRWSCFNLPDDANSRIQMATATMLISSPSLHLPIHKRTVAKMKQCRQLLNVKKRRAAYAKKKSKKQKQAGEAFEDGAEDEEEAPGVSSSTKPEQVVHHPKTWYPVYSAKSPTNPAEAFALYFDDNIIQMLVDKMKKSQT